MLYSSLNSTTKMYFQMHSIAQTMVSNRVIALSCITFFLAYATWLSLSSLSNYWSNTAPIPISEASDLRINAISSWKTERPKNRTRQESILQRLKNVL